MDSFHILLLLGGGLVGGTISSMVGGAAIVTYPVLIASGIPPLLATSCNMTALVPSNFIAAIADRSQLPPFNRAFAGLIFASVVGAGLGAAFLLSTPERVFELLVPLLLAFATLLFAFSGRIAGWLRARAEKRGREIGFSVTSLKLLLPVSFYGGYFGAGVGVLLLGVLSIATGGDYRSANVTKNLVTSLNSVVASAIFIWQGIVVWPQTLTLMAGTIAGGLIGSWLARVLPREMIRIMIVVAGAALTVVFAKSYWF